MERHVKAEVVLYRTDDAQLEIGVTLFGEPKQVSGEFRFLFKSVPAAFAHLLLDFELKLSSDLMDDLVNNRKITVPVDFGNSSELFEEIHNQFSIHQEHDFFGSYKEPIAEYGLIDVTDRDFACELAPKDIVNEIANAVRNADRPDSFYFLASSDSPDTLIQDVHFLTKDEMYIRKYGMWKVMNPVEWDRMEDTSDWQIRPELGVDFLKEFDLGGMTVGKGEKYAAPDSIISLDLTDSNIETPTWSPLVTNSRSGSNQNSREYFDCEIFQNEIHVHKIVSAYTAVSSDEFNWFSTYGGYFISNRNEWLFLVPVDNTSGTYDYEEELEVFMEELPFSMNSNYSCGALIEQLNSIGEQIFLIEKEPIQISQGSMSEFIRDFKSENQIKPGWTEYRDAR